MLSSKNALRIEVLIVFFFLIISQNAMLNPSCFEGVAIKTASLLLGPTADLL